MRNWEYVTKRVRLDIRDTKLTELNMRAEMYGFKNVNELLEELLCLAVEEELNSKFDILKAYWG